MKIPQIINEQPGLLTFGGARMALLEVQSGFWSIRRQMEALVGARLTNSVLIQAGVNGGASFAESMGTANDYSQQGRLFVSCVQAYQAAGFGRFDIWKAEWPIGRVVVRAQDAFEAWMINKHEQKVDGPVCAYTAGVLVGFVNVISRRRDVVCIERCCQAFGDQACEFELLPAEQAGDQKVIAFNPDPKLGRQVNLLEMLFERMPMGIAVIDSELKLHRCNPTWSAFIEKYTLSRASQVIPGVDFFDLQPDTQKVFIPLFDRVFDGETVRQDSVHIESGGIESFWDIVLTPLFEENRVMGLLNVSIDATERVRVEERLRNTLARLGESESMLRSVIENARHFAIYRVQIDSTDPDYRNVVLVSPSIRELVGVEQVQNFEKWFENLAPEDHDRIMEAHYLAIKKGIPFNQRTRFFNASENRWRWIRIISNPGFDALGHLTHFDGMIIDMTDQKEAELALQEINATLEQRVVDRTRELQTLLEVAATANSSLNLDEMLEITLDLLVDLINASRAGVMLRNETTGKLESRILRPEQIVSPQDLEQITRACDSVIENGEPIYVMPDVERGFVEPGALLPLRARDCILGVLVIIGEKDCHFSPEQLALFRSIADQLGVAVENARLYGQAEKVAIASERNRLARDLHDAVTQTLFSASLIAEVLPKLWEKNPQAGRQKLDELRQLTRGALSEMRTLLYELRPGTLGDFDLGDLVRHLTNAFIGRARIIADFNQEGTSTIMSPGVKEVFYRIAQEALNNITKHAEASKVHVKLEMNDDWAQIRISDDGLGFSQASSSGEKMGLQIMRERAESIGAQLEIVSVPGSGTQIRMRWESEKENRG
ncbi:MAG: GAF domain-containing protein [Anaerolineales bacterium]|nr:GAF domain-containing protein [Anaerolineales bacterium]